jgi:hypothetical protein
MIVPPFLPARADNSYRGHKLALGLLAVVVLMKLAIGWNSIFNGPSVLRSADGIPLDTFPPAAARAVVSLFALLGLSHVVIGIVSVLILIRYRALVPVAFGLLLLEHLGKRLVLYLLPIARVGRPPGTAINLVILALIVVGLALSLWRRDSLRRANEQSP